MEKERKTIEEEIKRQKRLEKEKEVEQRRKKEEERELAWLESKEATRKRKEEAAKQLKLLESEGYQQAAKVPILVVYVYVKVHKTGCSSCLNSEMATAPS